ncbi:hypothetical protein [Lacipirellula sp.]|uniref:hypothetical protein n=1 Tax=Lacipirellula sp. TaxID=2691419 RepID=UPI003D0A3C6E
MASERPHPSDDENREQPHREMRLDAAHPVRRAGGEARPRSGVMAMAGASDELVIAGQAAEQAFDDADPQLEVVAEVDADALPAWLGLDDASAMDGDGPLLGSANMIAQHAANLAERLQGRLTEVDRREARLNSQEAEFDSRIRNARLWIDQREGELTELQERLETWEAELTDRQTLAAAQLEEADELMQRLKELSEREKKLAAQELELELGVTEQQTKLDALDFETAGCRTRQLELDDARQKFEKRQRELDSREAKLYVEHERASHERLALDARQKELDARETRVITQEASLADCERRLAETAGELEFKRAELHQLRTSAEERTAALEADERRMEFRQREIETALKRFERLGIVEGRIAEVQQQADQIAMRSGYLDNAEAMLAERQLQISEKERELEHDRLAFENQVVRERRALASAEEASRLTANEQSRSLAHQHAELDKREQALEQVAEQLRATQREALEIRLATEETWLQLQGVLAPATLARSVAHVRARLTEQFQLTSDELKRRRSDLETARLEITDQFNALQQQRQELDRWAHNRDRDIENRASLLVAREQEIDAQQRHYQQDARRWEQERSEYQQEIQRLLAEIRNDFRAAA